jgi:hypothetical protein
MRKTSLLLAFAAIVAGSFALASPAGAVVCARGAHHASRAGPNGAVFARKPAPAKTCRIVDGVRVCKTLW